MSADDKELAASLKRPKEATAVVPDALSDPGVLEPHPIVPKEPDPALEKADAETLGKALSDAVGVSATGSPVKAPKKSECGAIHITRTFREGRIVKKDEVDTEIIEIRRYPAGTPLAQVGYNCRMTLNLQNYETAQVGVSVELPTAVEELGEAYEAAKHFVDTRLTREITSIKEYRDKKAGK